MEGSNNGQGTTHHFIGLVLCHGHLVSSNKTFVFCTSLSVTSMITWRLSLKT